MMMMMMMIKIIKKIYHDHAYVTLYVPHQGHESRSRHKATREGP